MSFLHSRLLQSRVLPGSPSSGEGWALPTPLRRQHPAPHSPEGEAGAWVRGPRLPLLPRLLPVAPPSVQSPSSPGTCCGDVSPARAYSPAQSPGESGPPWRREGASVPPTGRVPPGGRGLHRGTPALMESHVSPGPGELPARPPGLVWPLCVVCPLLVQPGRPPLRRPLEEPQETAPLGLGVEAEGCGWPAACHAGAPGGASLPGTARVPAVSQAGGSRLGQPRPPWVLFSPDRDGGLWRWEEREVVGGCQLTV